MTVAERDERSGGPQAAAAEYSLAKRSSKNTLQATELGGESNLFGDTRSELLAARSVLEARELELRSK